MNMKLDSLDLRILDELQRDGALSNVALARRVHLSPSPCLARVKALEDRPQRLAPAAGVTVTTLARSALRQQTRSPVKFPNA